MSGRLLGKCPESANTEDNGTSLRVQKNATLGARPAHFSCLPALVYVRLLDSDRARGPLLSPACVHSL